jgi:hypothetical protein
MRAGCRAGARACQKDAAAAATLLCIYAHCQIAIAANMATQYMPPCYPYTRASMQGIAKAWHPLQGLCPQQEYSMVLLAPQETDCLAG